MKKKPERNGTVSAEEFVRIWQSAESLDDVADQLGQSRHIISSRASRYRQHGVPLKRLYQKHGGSANDYDSLKKLAQELAPQGD